MSKYFDGIVPSVGDTWRADELYIKIRGEQKYLFAIIDDETRSVIAQNVLNKKEGTNARYLFQMASKITRRKPHTLVTDGLGSYHVAYLKEWWE